MPPKNLTNLAPELLIQILKSVDSFADVTSLSSTSRKMFIIWQTNLGVICEAILARTVPCYAQALELLDAQKKVEGDEHSVLGFQSVIGRAQWLSKGADTAAISMLCFESKLCGSWKENGETYRATMTLVEQTDFIRACYRATTLVTLGTDSLPSRMLSSWNWLDLEQVSSVMRWVSHHFQQRQLSVQPEYDTSMPILAGPGVTNGDSWWVVARSVIGLIGDVARLTIKPAPPGQRSRFPPPLYSSIVRDDYQDEYELIRGVHLGDLLPLVRKHGPLHNSLYRLSEV